MEHIRLTHENCHDPACMICSLFICKNCGLAEGSLTTDCPGYQCWTVKNEAIYEGKLDFRNGKWMNECSPHSPKYFQKETK